MGKMKKSILFCGVLTAALIMAGCKVDEGKTTAGSGDKTSVKNDSQAEGKEIKIGVAILDYSDQFQTYILDGMEEKEKELGDMKITYADSKYDPGLQMNQVENFIASNVDVVVIGPVDEDSGATILKDCIEADIPVISYNRPFANQEDAVSYVGSDTVVSGEIEMKAVAEKLNGKGNIVVISGTYGHQATIDRQAGYENILKDYPDIKIIAENTGNWYREEGMQVAENWIQSGMEINAIVCHNDEMAIGAYMALEDAGKSDDIFVAGIDGTEEALKYVKEGKLAISVFQDGRGQGSKAIEIAAKAARGEEVDKEYKIPYELITLENVDEFIARYEN
jgi:inositol transport system substrate-binding protein